MEVFQVNASTPRLNDSDIAHAAIQLHDWLKEGGFDGDLDLLYCRTRDGDGHYFFHSKCDNKGPTMTIIQTTEGHIIGGYSDVP